MFDKRNSRSINGLNLDKLREELRNYPLDLAIAFGSWVKGDFTKLSDFDLAVKFKANLPGKEKIGLMDKITVTATDQMGIEAIDLLDLDRVEPEIGYQALKEGKLILGSPEEANSIQSKFLLKKLDFAPVKKEWRKAMTERIEKGDYAQRK